MSSLVECSTAAIDQIITFEAGPSASNVTNIMISIFDDFVALEANETFIATLEILGAPDNVVLGQYRTATVTVIDDDRKSLVGNQLATVSLEILAGIKFSSWVLNSHCKNIGSKELPYIYIIILVKFYWLLQR